MSDKTAVDCDCGWTGGPYRSEAVAEVALTRHSCERYTTVTAPRAARVAARELADGPKRECRCSRAHHEHGTHEAYTIDRCHCRLCRDGHAAYERHRSRQRAYGREALVDAGPAREHIERLREQGMCLRAVAASAGLGYSCVSAIVGAPSTGRAPRGRIRSTTMVALMAVRFTSAPGAPVDGTGTRRRLQALVAVGWSQAELSRRLGVTRGNGAALVRGARGRVAPSTRDAVARLYDRLWDQAPPEETKDEKSAKIKAQNVAKRHGWPPPLAWDEDTIGDPTASAWVEIPATRRARGATHAAWQAEVDQVAVERAVAGDPPVGMTRGERVEAVRLLALAGLSDSQIAVQLRIQVRSVERLRADNEIACGRSSRPRSAA